MKNFVLLFGFFYSINLLAQAIPDYSATNFGLSKDVIKSEDYDYEYNPDTNAYDIYQVTEMTFENGLLKQKFSEFKSWFSSKTTTNYTYNSAGKISKEVETSVYTESTSESTTTYVYTGSKLTQKVKKGAYENTTTQYTYDNKGKLTKAETKKDDGTLVSIEEFSNITDEKNYTKVTRFYYGTIDTPSNTNTEVYVKGHYISFLALSKDYGDSNYDYMYDPYGNVTHATEDNVVVEKNTYEYDAKGNWIKCKSYLDDWLGGTSDHYKFRKVTYKTGSVGSTTLDQSFLDKYPSTINKPTSTNTATTSNQSGSKTTPSVSNTSNTTPKSATNPGCEGNCVDGYGSYYYSDGSVYDGFFKNSLRHGPGIITFSGGGSYTGNWVNGNREGYGMMGFADGSSYAGYHSDNKLNGEGVFIDAKQVVYGGVFKDGNFTQTFHLNDNGATTGCISGDCYNGFGKMIYSGGNVFLGFFKNGYLSHGIYVYSVKDSYIGEYVNGKKQGFGVYTWTDKNNYMGMYQNDTYHGLGYYYVEADETKDQIGEFRNGSLYLNMK
jgi:hypothetical protein